MSSRSFAEEEVMEDYMSALLTEGPSLEVSQTQAVEQLLKSIPAPRSEPFEVSKEKSVETKPVVAKVVKPQVEKKIAAVLKPVNELVQVLPTENFQVLIFEVAGMTLAVPLTELGGIHEFESVNQLFGKPAWFEGVMLLRDEKYNVVNTIKWLMPENVVEKVAESTKYQYLIVLGESNWGLSCESVVNNVTLSPDDVKWRNLQGSRPWVSGMIKKKMCALVNVKQLVSMLDQGLSSNDLPDSGRSNLNE
ncbi:chemotaxis protein CheW [uncultured Paraglaciecola sp.]|uniref:chemotaxis protein CheW n=1 Tax=uncultured Paraglaciecola sp. TaxID=1765024 RepID=UPI0025924973|nr:chemotaxis protein CheW [uncultured Paraglaciecola sp.]